MDMAAIIQFLGGIRATVFAALMVAALVLAGARSCSLTDVRATLANERTEWAKQSLAQAEAYIAAQQRARAAEQALSTAQAKADTEYLRGHDDAEAKQAAVVADLGAGSLRLRQLWQGCVATSGLAVGVAAAAGQADAGADVRSAAAGRIVRIGAEADNQVRWLQSTLIATRTMCGAASPP